MAKIIRLGLLPPDHLIYSGGPEMFSPRAFNPSSTSSAPSTAGATQDKSQASQQVQKPQPFSPSQK